MSTLTNPVNVRLLNIEAFKNYLKSETDEEADALFDILFVEASNGNWCSYYQQSLELLVKFTRDLSKQVPWLTETAIVNLQRHEQLPCPNHIDAEMGCVSSACVFNALSILVALAQNPAIDEMMLSDLGGFGIFGSPYGSA